MNRKGFTLVEIIITVAIIGMIASIAIPVAINMVADAREGVCKENLRTIDNAKVAWAVDNNQPDDAEPEEDALADYVKGDFPQPVVAGALYRMGNVVTAALCSYHGNSIISRDGSGITLPDSLLNLVNSGAISASSVVDDNYWMWFNNSGWAFFLTINESDGIKNTDMDTEAEPQITVNGSTIKANFMLSHFSKDYLETYYGEDFEPREGNYAEIMISQMTEGGYEGFDTAVYDENWNVEKPSRLSYYDHNGQLMGYMEDGQYWYDSEGNLIN